MTRTYQGYQAAFFAAAFVFLRMAGSPAVGQQRHAGPPPEEGVASLVQDLADPSYQVRTAATRRLCAIGPRAGELLRKVAEGKDMEAALRAKMLLTTFDRLLFAGVNVTLAFSKTEIAWDEPTDLLITMANRSKYPARIPFQTDVKEADANDDARQVGTMLDVSDWLDVQRVDGRKIELCLDDILADPRVVDTVNERVLGGGFGILPAGAQVTVTARAFNRGWARYSLLDHGKYHVVLEYVPPWEDETLAAERVGRVASNRAEITVTDGAPPAVSRGHAEAALALERHDRWLHVTLTNTTDQLMFVNKNFGRETPFARASWVCTLDESVHKITLGPKRQVGWGEFDEGLLVEVPPGQLIELDRIQIGELRDKFTRAGANLEGNRWTVGFVYSNLCDRQWQSRQSATLSNDGNVPQVLQTPLPRRLLSASHSSNRLTAPAPD